MGWPGPVTHRQHITYLAWLVEEMNRPSRADWYAMGVTTAVKQVLSQKPAAIKIEHQKLQFGESESSSDGKEKTHKSTLTREQAAELSKARWGGFFGRDRKPKRIPPAAGKG